MDRRAFLAALAASAACQRSNKTVIGVVPKGTVTVYWQAVRAGSEAAARDAGVEILWNGPVQETDYARQIQIVDSMINSRLDGIVLAPCDSNALVGVVERAAREGVPVSIFDSGIETENYVSYVATNNEDAGRLAARKVAELIGEKGPVAIVRHVPGSDSTGRRERGFEAELKEKFPGLEIVAEQYCQGDRARALAVAEDILTAHTDLAAFFCSSESSTVGTARAIRGRDKAGAVKVVGFDASPDQQDDLRDDVISALVVQDPRRIGYVGVETIMKKLRGETPEKRIDLPARVVTAADLDDPEVQRLLNPGV